MSAHARLAPSSAETWISCPASIRMADKVPHSESSGSSSYAEEGTRAHELAELTASWAFGLISKKVLDRRLERWRAEHELVTDEVFAEMEVHVASYVALIRERKAQIPHSQVLFEQRMKTGIPNCWGTSDTVIVSPRHVEIIDLKYGQGVAVYADENPQLMLYGVGALDTFGDVLGDTEFVRVTVFQPRLDSTSSYELTADELRAWRDGVAEVAKVALGPDAPFGPSDTACRWCPAAGICRARMEFMTARDFGTDTDVMEPQELADWLDRAPGIRAWLSSVEDYALDAMYSHGKVIPGFKVGRSGGRRTINDHPAAIKKLVAAGYHHDAVSRTTLKTLGDLEKLIGKKELPDVLGPLMVKGEGSPSIVREKDARPAIAPNAEAASEFNNTTLD